MSDSSFSAAPPPRIHPFKRMAAQLARVLPRSWRFPVCGLPADTSSVAKPEMTATGIRHVPGGLGCHLGAHLDGRDILIEEMPPPWAEQAQRRFLHRQRFFPRVRRVRGDAASIVFGAHTNFFHWMFETLPRLRYLQESGLHYDWLYACQKHSFHRESLAAVGTRGAEIVDSGTTPFLRADKFILPPLVQHEEPWIVPWVREQLLPLAEKAGPAEFPCRIYISRRKATSRDVTNEPEVLELFGSFGFTPVFLEDLSLAGQIALFRQAEAVAGPHGAGFTNLVFSEPGTFVLEFRQEGDPRNLYGEISRQREINHQAIFCAAQDKSMRMDIARTRELLQSTFGST